MLSQKLQIRLADASLDRIKIGVMKIEDMIKLRALDIPKDMIKELEQIKAICDFTSIELNKNKDE